jgi:hypothetical protein
MRSRIIAIVGIAGALTVVGAGASHADTYPPALSCVVSSPTLDPGQSTVIECGGDGAIESGTSAVFTVSGPGASTGTLAAVFAPVGTTQVTKTVTDDGSVSATFTAPEVTSTSTYTISVSDAAGRFAATAAVTVNAAAEGGDGPFSGTGGGLPTWLIWVGLGALGLGVVAVIVAINRKRRSLEVKDDD